MEIDEQIIRNVLFKHTDIPERGINRLVDRMKTRQNKINKSEEETLDRMVWGD